MKKLEHGFMGLGVFYYLVMFAYLFLSEAHWLLWIFHIVLYIQCAGSVCSYWEIESENMRIEKIIDAWEKALLRQVHALKPGETLSVTINATPNSENPED